MSNELKGTNVSAPIVPFTSADTYPTHYALYGKGGFRCVQTIAERDAIPDLRKEEGMLVYVVEDPEQVNTYQWLEGEWAKSKIGAGVDAAENWEEILEGLKNGKYEAGDIVYNKEGDRFYIVNQYGELMELLKLYVGSVEPKDKSVVWIDVKSGEPLLDGDSDSELNKLKEAVTDLQHQIQDLNRLVTVGIVPGDVQNSYRRVVMRTAEPLRPEGVPGFEEQDAAGDFTGSTPDSMLGQEEEEGETPEDTSTEEKPDESVAQPTVHCICAKLDTSDNFYSNRQDLVDGEILFYTDENTTRRKIAIYYQGQFYSGSGTGTSSGSGGSGISLDDLYALSLEYLNFKSPDNKTYRTRVTREGHLVAAEYNQDTIMTGAPDSSWGVYVNPLLSMNTIFCGGSEPNENNMCSHNFVELANGSTKDVNLKGIYLLYSANRKESPADIGYIWEVLPLEGVIKAGSTYLIRGAECNPTKSRLIEVHDPDMEWKLSDGSLMSFEQENSSFYLVAGIDFRNLLENKTLNNPWISQDAGGPRPGYIDSCGFGSNAVNEGTDAFLVPNNDWKNSLFVRTFSLDPSKQANKAYDSRKTPNLWTCINLSKQTERLGNSIQYYWQDWRKQLDTPKASWEGKNFFTNKSDFNPEHPNIINILFGRQATDGGATKRASRTFNWVSVGYYDEFLEYRLKGSTTWTKVYSITPNNSANDEAINTFMDFYQRLRWKSSSGLWVTSHKCIIKDLSAGEYEYRVGRDGAPNYYSDVMEFKVHADNEVTNFSYIQVTDQQGFTWAEYQAWKKSAFMIREKEFNYNFTVNTGDATQSGNRPNEWLDYWDARQYLRNKEEMFTIGNNDLCGHVSTELTDGNDSTSKYSHINVLRYYTFELDPENPYNFFTWTNNEGVIKGNFPIYSLYSFNYGKWHFVSLNSEIAQATSKMYEKWTDLTYSGDRTFADQANAQIENWLKKDLQLWKGTAGEPRNCDHAIVYMHEMPFTIVTWDFMKGSSARVGSHLNTLDSKGEYRFSRLFKEYGIRLVMGGHKHTYCLSKPIYDAPEGYITDDYKVADGVDLMSPMNSTDSRKPVIQILNQPSQEDKTWGAFGRYEVVNKITAPTYVMSQATGYKLVSNKEMPSGNEFQIPWLMAYFKANSNATSPKENVRQHMPMYIRYDVSDENIVVTAKQVQNVWNVNVDTNKSSLNMNEQLPNLDVNSMTLSTITDNDRTAYGITNLESYTIQL